MRAALAGGLDEGGADALEILWRAVGRADQAAQGGGVLLDGVGEVQVLEQAEHREASFSGFGVGDLQRSSITNPRICTTCSCHKRSEL